MILRSICCKSKSFPTVSYPFDHAQQMVQNDYVIKILGDKGSYDSIKEFVLLPHTSNGTSNKPSSKLASLLVKRNIIFGARVHQPDLSINTSCAPLLNQALNSASEYGDQPQALASLYGLSKWVCSCFRYVEEHNTFDNPSKTLTQLLQSQDNDESKVILQAVKAIATQLPRPGQTVLGMGTYRDGQPGWENLAKEYASSMTLDGEPPLYRNFGGQIVKVEYLADTSPNYLKEAGGAILRYFFL